MEAINVSFYETLITKTLTLWPPLHLIETKIILKINLMTETVPQVFFLNHSGLFLRLMLTTSNGIPFASNVKTVLWAYGQNLK